MANGAEPFPKGCHSFAKRRPTLLQGLYYPRVNIEELARAGNDGVRAHLGPTRRSSMLPGDCELEGRALRIYDRVAGSWALRSRQSSGCGRPLGRGCGRDHQQRLDPRVEEASPPQRDRLLGHADEGRDLFARQGRRTALARGSEDDARPSCDARIHAPACRQPRELAPLVRGELDRRNGSSGSHAVCRAYYSSTTRQIAGGGKVTQASLDFMDFCNNTMPARIIEVVDTDVPARVELHLSGLIDAEPNSAQWSAAHAIARQFGILPGRTRWEATGTDDRGRHTGRLLFERGPAWSTREPWLR